MHSVISWVCCCLFMIMSLFFYLQPRVRANAVNMFSYHPLTKAERFCRKFGNFFPPLFDSACRMFRQKLWFQRPKTFTPKKCLGLIYHVILHV